MTAPATFDVARWLVEARNFSVIPLEARGKKPVAKWSAFQSERPTADNLAAWFSNGADRNLGIVCGAISNIVAVDCDSPEAIIWADTHLPPTPMATRTAKGEHRFYKHPGVPVRNTARIHTGDTRLPLDIRGDGGFVVAPSSIHPSGFMYERVGAWPPVDELPIFDPTWIESEPASIPMPVITPQRSRQIGDRDLILNRARKYLEATPPAIEGQGGDGHTFQVCCRLVRGFNLDDADAFDLLRDWNSRCVPPWTDDELLEKIAGARKYGNEPLGGRLDKPHSDAAPHADEWQTAPAPSDAREVNLDDEVLEPAEATSSISSTSISSTSISIGQTPEDRLTEAGAAERFARVHGDDVRFDHRRGRWLMWERHRWVPDADAAVTRLALNFARTWQRDAIEIPDPDRREKVFKAAVRLERRDALQSMLTFAGAIKPIADAGEAWDCDPMLLGVVNGVINLRTGTRRDGRRDDGITMSAAVPFDQTATCPRWKQFLLEILGGNNELIGFVQRAVGYSLTGITSEQCLLVLYGTGANGKSTFVITIKFVLGDYSWNMPFATIELKDRSAIPNDLAALVGRRFVIASETNDGTRLNESRVKALTGSDPVTARFLHREFFEFEPVAKFWLSVNHKPVVQDDSHGFWRRIRLIPFRQQFPPNPALSQILRAEAPGILTWAVEGCLAWQREGLRPPAIVTEATAEYEAESDVLREFLDEAIEMEPGSEVGARDLFEHYQRWAKQHGMHERDLMKVQLFGRKMGERFEARKDRASGVKHYLGIARKGVFP